MGGHCNQVWRMNNGDEAGIKEKERLPFKTFLRQVPSSAYVPIIIGIKRGNFIYSHSLPYWDKERRKDSPTFCGKYTL